MPMAAGGRRQAAWRMVLESRGLTLLSRGRTGDNKHLTRVTAEGKGGGKEVNTSLALSGRGEGENSCGGREGIMQGRRLAGIGGVSDAAGIGDKRAVLDFFL